MANSIRKKPRANGETTPELKCDFCKRSFTTEGRLLRHTCEQKRRYQQRDEKHVKLGFMAYVQFYRRSMPRKGEPTYASFAKSSLYLAFVRFGRHLMDLNAVNPMNFVDFLLRIEAPIDRWLSPMLYQTYIRELNKNEAPLDALQRNFELMAKWANEHNDDWRTFFKKIDVPLAALWIANGRISPWILFTASSAHDLLQRLNPEQVELIETSIDPEFWRLKIERHSDDVEWIRTVLAEHGI